MQEICPRMNILKGDYFKTILLWFMAHQKVQKSYFQSQFSMSKVIQNFLFFFIEEYQFRGIFVVIEIFWKNHFLNHFVTEIMAIFQSPPTKRMLICQKLFLWKSAIFHSIKLPFDAEKFLKVIYTINSLSIKKYA